MMKMMDDVNGDITISGGNKKNMGSVKWRRFRSNWNLTITGGEILAGDFKGMEIINKSSLIISQNFIYSLILIKQIKN